MIRKTSETRPLAGHIVNAYDDSQNSAYATEYTNAMNTYSTDETFTGKYWIDGKPIYRKVISNTTSSTVNTEKIIGNISNLDTLIKLEGVIDIGSYGLIPIPQSVTNEVVNTLYIPNKSTGAIAVKITNNAYKNVPVWVIVEYTKTTD